MALTRNAAESEIAWPTSAVARRLAHEPTLAVTSRTGVQPGSLLTRLMTPPEPPRPKIIAFGPFNASTLSMLYRSR
jgi:hypothetical protein